MIEEFGPAHTFSGLNIYEREKVQLSFSMLSLYDIEYYYISYGNTGTLMRRISIAKNPQNFQFALYKTKYHVIWVLK
jgi:hypothetical protein